MVCALATFPTVELAIIVLYCFFALILQRRASKTGYRYGWMAWIPVLNLYLLHELKRRAEPLDHKGRIRQRWLYAGVVLADLVFVSYWCVWWKEQYCDLCGRLRSAVALSPFAPAIEGLLIPFQERPTPLSEVLEPLWGEKGHVHEWVTRGHQPIWDYLAGDRPELGHGLDRSVSYSLWDGQERFSNVAAVDPELALAAARILLHPYASYAEQESRTKPFLDALFGLSGPCPVTLNRWRSLCGLPPNSKWVARIGLSPLDPPKSGSFRITLSNGGTTPLLVDRELVFGISIRVPEAIGGFCDGFELADTLPSPTPEEFGTRFVELVPGERMSRDVDLKDGFRTFRWEVTTHPGRRSRVRAYECMLRLPREVEPKTVMVTYDTLENVPAGAFREYVGSEAYEVMDNLGFRPPAVGGEMRF